MKGLKLDLEIIEIKDICFGEETKIEGGTLTIDRVEMIDYLADPVFTGISVDLAKPGDSVRIIPVKDVIEPRVKIDNDGGAFPGFFGKFEGCGDGRTKVLRGCSVVTTGAIVGFQEGIIDMSGPGAQYTQFSRLNNVVLTMEVEAGIHPAKHEEAVRIAGIKAAYYLAKAAKDLEPDYVEGFELSKVDSVLPKVAIMYMIMAQGLLHDNYFYGVDAKRLHPSYIHPNEIFDGALVSGNCVVAGDKNTTYDHQNNPMIKELYSRHGRDVNFRGLILVPTYPGLADKERCCHGAVNTARLLGVDGVILPEEGGGNPEADIMMIVRNCEHCGIKTVIMLGPDGVEEPLADTAPEADAVINVGDCNEFVILPPMEKTIGHQEQVKMLSGGAENSLREDGGIRVSLSAIMGSVNGLGVSRMSSYVY